MIVDKVRMDMFVPEFSSWGRGTSSASRGLLNQILFCCHQRAWLWNCSSWFFADTQNTEPFASPSLSVVPCSIPCQHPVGTPGTVADCAVTSVGQPSRTVGREENCSCWSAAKLGTAAGAAHGAAWEKLSFRRSGVHEQAGVCAVWVPALPFPVKSRLQL